MGTVLLYSLPRRYRGFRLYGGRGLSLLYGTLGRFPLSLLSLNLFDYFPINDWACR